MGNKGAANRCKWVNLKNPAYIRYHDTEWGVPQHKDEVLFEMLFLEWFQAGLSWECILNKREGFRRAFDGFDAECCWTRKIKVLQLVTMLPKTLCKRAL